MLVIRTAEEMDIALSSPLDHTLKERLKARRDHLLAYPDYPFEELGVFIIVQPHDRLDDLNQAARYHLIGDEGFTIEAETVDRHGNWLELLFVLSDDGFGLVLFVPLLGEVDPAIRTACQTLAPWLRLAEGG